MGNNVLQLLNVLRNSVLTEYVAKLLWDRAVLRRLIVLKDTAYDLYAVPVSSKTAKPAVNQLIAPRIYATPKTSVDFWSMALHVSSKVNVLQASVILNTSVANQSMVELAQQMKIVRVTSVTPRKPVAKYLQALLVLMPRIVHLEYVRQTPVV